MFFKITTIHCNKKELSQNTLNKFHKWIFDGHVAFFHIFYYRFYYSFFPWNWPMLRQQELLYLFSYPSNVKNVCTAQNLLAGSFSFLLHFIPDIKHIFISGDNYKSIIRTIKLLSDASTGAIWFMLCSKMPGLQRLTDWLILVYYSPVRSPA